MSKNEKVETFEALYNELEKIINKLNDENTKLEDAINIYKEGIAISKKLEEIINDAKKAIVEIEDREKKNNWNII